jgi:hypothetical protein
MTASQATKAALGLSIAGTLFAGFLTFSSMVLKRCAFGEPCPRLFNLPTCLFGFAFFLTLALLTAASVFKLMERKTADELIVIVAAGGTIFALRFALPEVAQIFGGRHFAMGLPTCAWGGIFFIAVLTLSIIAYRRRRSEEAPVVAKTN